MDTIWNETEPYFDPVRELADLLREADSGKDIEELIDEYNEDELSRNILPLRIPPLPSDVESHPVVAIFLAELHGKHVLTRRGRQLAKLRVDAGDPQALEALLVSGIPLVLQAASQQMRHVDEFMDLVQEGMLGLMHAIRRWDPKRGSLWVYARYWIYQRMQRYKFSLGSVVRVPAYAFQFLQKIVRREQSKLEAGGEIPEHQKVAPLLPPLSLNSDLSRCQGVSIREQLLQVDSCDIPLEDGQLWYEEAAVVQDWEEEVLDRIYREQVRHWFYEQPLDARQRQVLEDRFGFRGKCRTLQEIGDELGLTRERVRQIERKAIQLLNKSAQRIFRQEQLSQLDRQPTPREPGAQGKAIRDDIARQLRHLSVPLQQPDLSALFEELFSAPTERDFALRLRKFGAPKLARLAHQLVKVPAVQELLTQKQRSILSNLGDIMISLSERERGFVERALVRLYRRLAPEA